MAKFNFWDFTYALDNIYYELVNYLLKSSFWIKKSSFKKTVLQKNSLLKNKHFNERAFVIGNGPSVKKQNLKLLKNEITFFVNRSFLHEDYEYIQPTYHIFIDPKLATGEWEITMLDQVKEKSPNVIFLLNAKWYYLDKFQPYINDSQYTIYWIESSLFFTPFYNRRKIDLTTVTYNSAVLGQGIYTSIYMGIKDIYVLGAEGNAFCHEMVNQESHFYGGNPENNNKSIQTTYTELYRNYIYLKHLFFLSQYVKNQNCSIYNCTIGGIMNMFERKEYENLF